jgi:hypothetical protein
MAHQATAEMAYSSIFAGRLEDAGGAGVLDQV